MGIGTVWVLPNTVWVSVQYGYDLIQYGYRYSMGMGMTSYSMGIGTVWV